MNLETARSVGRQTAALRRPLRSPEGDQAMARPEEGVGFATSAGDATPA